jgi:hypothetical protein
VFTVECLDLDRLCFWDITNILELYLRYNYKDLPCLSYTFDNQSNEEIHGLTKDKDITYR